MITVKGLQQLRKNLETLNAQMDADAELLREIFDEAIQKVADLDKPEEVA